MKINVKSDCRGMSADFVIDRIFYDRGVDDPQHFLSPTIDDLLPFTDLEYIEEAGEIVISCVENQEKIAILADTDVDGVTSCAIIYRYLKRLGADVTTFINDGKMHGLQENDIDKYKNFRLLIIVDSLNSDIDEYIELYQDSETHSIIVLDHHAINPSVPYDKWITLVSSQRSYGNKNLSGAGVCMKFVLYLDQVLELNYADNLYDLCVSGEIADMMDVTDPENRYLMYKGFENINNPAIKKIAGGFGWNAKSVAFSIAPLINSAVRMGKNEYAKEIFLTDDNDEVLTCLKKLKKCKDEQNKLVNSMMADIEDQIKDQINNKMIVVFIDTEYGVTGLIGNKLLEKYKRPILILKEYKDYYSGSMRAVGVDDFRQLINDSKLATASGHELASGISVPVDNLQDLIDYMEDKLPAIGEYEEKIDADIWADVNDIDRNYIDRIQELNQVSGTGFPSIKVYLDGIKHYHITDMSGGKHLVIELNNSDLKLIQWNFNGDWEEFEDAEMFGEELEAVIELQSGYIGRTFMLQGIINYVGIKE